MHACIHFSAQVKFSIISQVYKLLRKIASRIYLDGATPTKLGPNPLNKPFGPSCWTMCLKNHMKCVSEKEKNTTIFRKVLCKSQIM